jgi:hypothetical protein
VVVAAPLHSLSVATTDHFTLLLRLFWHFFEPFQVTIVGVLSKYQDENCSFAHIEPALADTLFCLVGGSLPLCGFAWWYTTGRQSFKKEGRKVYCDGVWWTLEGVLSRSNLAHLADIEHMLLPDEFPKLILVVIWRSMVLVLCLC